MSVRRLTFADIDRLTADADEASAALRMDEDVFRPFYDRTAAPLWAYLRRATGDGQAADDLLQETYYRFLRAEVEFESAAHQRNYLFRIATNLVRDRRRRPGLELPLADPDDERMHPREEGAERRLEARRDVGRALEGLRPRDRDLLWFAYALGLSHAEVAEVVGVKTGSVKPLLHRARTRLADLLGRRRGKEGTRS